METNKSDHLRIEKRFNSIRSLPQGQFLKYRQMFDTLTKRKEKEKLFSLNNNNNNNSNIKNENKIDECTRELNYKSISTQTSVENQLIKRDQSAETSPIHLIPKIKPIFENEQELEDLISNLSIYKKDSNENILEMPFTDDEKSKHIFNFSANVNTTNSSNNNVSNTDESLSNESYLNDLEKFEIEMDKIFDGVSDETNLLLNSLCSNNRYIADFFDKSETNKPASCSNSNRTEQLTDTSTSSFLSESSSISSSRGSIDTQKQNSSPNQTQSVNLYTAIPIETNFDNDLETSRKSIKSDILITSTLKSPSINSFTSFSINSCLNDNKISKTVQEPNETIITYVIDIEKEDVALNKSEIISINNQSSNDESNKTTNTEISSASSLSLNSSVSNTKLHNNDEHETQLVTSTISTIEPNQETNYFELDDVDFSDDSYDEEEMNQNIKKTVKFVSPPPKPARTFEHDIYIQKQTLSQNKELSNSCIITNFEPTKSDLDQSDRASKVKSLYNPNEHIYETLPSIKHLNLEHNSNNKTANNSKKLLKNDLLTKKSTFIKKKNRDLNMSPNKFAVSEPNLTQIGKNRKIKNEIFLKPIGKIFNHFKKSLSRKNVNVDGIDHKFNADEEIMEENSDEHDEKNLADENETQTNEPESFKSDVVFRNNQPNKNSVTKSYIYSDLNELNNKIKTLFECVLIVGIKDKKHHSTDELNIDEYINKTSPIILWKFPDNIEQINQAIPEFCFPDLDNRNDYKKNESEIFQFTLTNFEGDRTYGYCIRLCQKNKNPIVVCIISQIDALEMYYTILVESEKVFLNEGLEEMKLLLSSIYPKSFPNRGESLLVTLGLNDKKEIILNRSIDRRLEHINLYTILNYPFDFIIKIFASMLSEKKIIFLSSKLSSLSNTIQAFELLLYPFNWPHTYIPVLPSFLIEMTEAPTPYIIGLMRSCKNELLKYKGCNDMLIVDLDKQKFIQENQNELKILPDSIVKSLKVDLYNLVHISKSLSEYEKNVELCKIFLKVFLKTVGNYKYYIFPFNEENSNEESFKFLYKEFVNDAKTSEMKDFLEMFVNSQLFEVFINKKLIPGAKFGLMFDEAVRQDQIQSKNGLSNSPKTTTVKQIKNKDKSKKQRF